MQLRERLYPASPVVATLTPGEWVEPIDGQLRLIPLRGVVNRAIEKPPLAVGDIVCMLENGQTGWAKDPSLECMGLLAGDTNCRP